MTIRSKRQEEALTKRRNEGLDATALNDPGFSCQGVIGEFVGLYLQCEVFATKLQHFYQTDKQQKKSRFNTKSLTEALEYFSLHFDHETLIALFQGGEGKRGKKSARQLRNGYLHQLSMADSIEICDKSSKYIKAMRVFLLLRITIKSENIPSYEPEPAI